MLLALGRPYKHSVTWSRHAMLLSTLLKAAARNLGVHHPLRLPPCTPKSGTQFVASRQHGRARIGSIQTRRKVFGLFGSVGSIPSQVLYRRTDTLPVSSVTKVLQRLICDGRYRSCKQFRGSLLRFGATTRVFSALRSRTDVSLGLTDKSVPV
jgi:hypothetical protein